MCFWLSCVQLLRPLEPCKNLGREGGYGTKPQTKSECGGQILIGGVPEGLVALRPSSEGWPCRSTRPAAGSTPPRQRCSPAGLRAGRLLLRPPPWPEGQLDLREGGAQETH